MVEDIEFTYLMYYFLGHNTVTPAHLPHEERYQKTAAYTKKLQSDAKWYPELIEEAKEAGFTDEEREGEATVVDEVLPSIKGDDAIKALEKMMSAAGYGKPEINRYVEVEDTHMVYHFTVYTPWNSGGFRGYSPSGFLETLGNPSKEQRVLNSSEDVLNSEADSLYKVTVEKLTVNPGKTVGDYVLSDDTWRKRLGVSTLTQSYARIREMKKAVAELPGLIEKGRRHYGDNEQRLEDKMPFNAKPTGQTRSSNIDVPSLAEADRSLESPMLEAVETGDTIVGDLKCKDTGEQWTYTMTIMTTDPARYNDESAGQTYCPGVKAFLKGVYSQGMDGYKIGSVIKGEATDEWPRKGIHTGLTYGRRGSVTLELTFQGPESLKRTMDADTFWKNHFYLASNGKEDVPSYADPYPRMGWRK